MAVKEERAVSMEDGNRKNMQRRPKASCNGAGASCCPLLSRSIACPRDLSAG